MKLKKTCNNHHELKINNSLTIIKKLLTKAIKETTEDIQKQQKQSQPRKRKSDSTSETQEVNEVIDVLKKGYIMTKHSNKSTSKPKFVYLSMSQKFLCWKSVDKSDEKRMEVSNISNVMKGGQRFLDRNSKIKYNECCITIASEERLLVLEAANPMEGQLFEEDIQRAIKYCRKMSLNYVYLVQ